MSSSSASMPDDTGRRHEDGDDGAEQDLHERKRDAVQESVEQTRGENRHEEEEDEFGGLPYAPYRLG